MVHHLNARFPRDLTPFAKPIGPIPTWGSEGLGAGMATNRANIVNAPW